jgi:hypothetical protein
MLRTRQTRQLAHRWRWHQPYMPAVIYSPETFSSTHLCLLAFHVPEMWRVWNVMMYVLVKFTDVPLNCQQTSVSLNGIILSKSSLPRSCTTLFRLFAFTWLGFWIHCKFASFLRCNNFDPYYLDSLQLKFWCNLKGSDDGVWHSELLGFCTLSIVQNSKFQKTQCFRNWICFLLQVRGRRRLLYWVPYKELTSITGHTLMVP